MSAQSLIDRDGVVTYHSGVFSDWKVDDLIEGINWRQNDIRIFGKVYQEPRLTAWYGPAYKYSSIQWEAQSFPMILQPLLTEVSKLADFEFNAVLLNYYRNGQDGMGWHRDNEKEIDESCIASLSLGATRAMDFRHRQNKEKIRIQLEHGSLLLMRDCQENWEHQIPKSKRIQDARVNLTFRRILS